MSYDSRMNVYGSYDSRKKVLRIRTAAVRICYLQICDFVGPVRQSYDDRTSNVRLPCGLCEFVLRRLAIKASFTSAVQQPCDRLRLESQGICKRSYSCRTNSQRRTIDCNVARMISRCLFSLRSACEVARHPCKRRSKSTMTSGLDTCH